MKKHLLILTGILSLAVTSAAQGAVINAYWSFNDGNSDVTAVSAGSTWDTTNPTLSTSFTGDGEFLFDNANGEIPSPFTAFDGNDYSRGQDGLFLLDNRQNKISSSPVTMSDPTIAFTVDMTNLEDFKLRMDVRPSALGGGDAPQASRAIEYNTGSGWLDSGLSISGLAANDPNVVNLDFSGVSAIEGQSNVQLRIIWDDLTAGAANNNFDLAKLEFDNVQIEATVIPEPQASLLILSALGLLLVSRRVRRFA